jgi:hypothetical protein
MNYNGVFQCVSIILSLVIYLSIVGGITRFRYGISTLAQRGWFISWAIMGVTFGPFIWGGYRDYAVYAESGLGYVV